VTAIGGTGDDLVKAAIVGPDGSVYLTGYTDSFDFPVSPGAFNSTNRRSGSVFVMKLGASGTSLEYAAVLGGDGFDMGTGIALDAQGNVVVIGQTSSTDFPLTASPPDPIANSSEAFVFKLSGDGRQLLFSTFLGGEDWDEATAVTVDESGDLYVTGVTTSLDFPASPTFQPGWRGYDDVFVVKLSADGQSVRYATVLSGGFGDERARDIVVDGSGSVYVVGESSSIDFPVTAGALNTTLRGGIDVFITKLAPSGTSLVYSTLLGGNDGESGGALVVDAFGRVSLVGMTGSEDFPVSAMAPNKVGADADTFAARLSADGARLEYASVLGGNGSDYGTAIVVDSAGRIIVGGWTGSQDFPNATYAVPSDPVRYSANCFLALLDPASNTILEAHVLGGTNEEECVEVGMDGAGDAYLIGSTFSEDLPRNESIPQAHSSFWDVFVAKFRLPVHEEPSEPWRLWVAIPALGVMIAALAILLLRRRKRDQSASSQASWGGFAFRKNAPSPAARPPPPPRR